MSHDRDVQFHTETPYLPQPLAWDVIETLTQPVETIAEAEARHARISTFRHQVAAAIDTIELAIAQNHADYLGGRKSWSYDTRIEVDARVKILKRQRQHLQDAYGQCNRRLKRMQQEALEQQRVPPADMTRAHLFVQVATQFLAPETITMLWELVENQTRLINGTTAQQV
jgi:hypothetical protein